MIDGFSNAQLAVCGALVYFAGFVDSLAGGGGLITLPAYLAVGLNPALVLGTNKLASSIGTVASCFNYQRRQKLKLGDLAPAAIAAVVGSFLGARLATRLDPSYLRIILLVVLPVLAAFLYTRRSFGGDDNSHRYHAKQLSTRAAIVSFPLGCYDGFFGPGTGTFFALALTRFCHYDLLGATGRAKILNLVTNIAALAAFLLAGRVHWRLGLLMGAASLLGHYTGSHFGLKRGPTIIRPIVIVVCSALFVKLLADLWR